MKLYCKIRLLIVSLLDHNVKCLMPGLSNCLLFRKLFRRFFSHKILIGNNTANMKFILNVDQDISRVGKVNQLDILFKTVLFYTKHFV